MDWLNVQNTSNAVMACESFDFDEIKNIKCFREIFSTVYILPGKN